MIKQLAICGIYRITNLINGKVYIGQSRNIIARKSQHKYDMRNGGRNEYLYRAMRKYGFDKFLFEIIEECIIEQLNELEQNYIKKFNSLIPNGYNIEAGGHVPLSMSQYTRDKISKAFGRPTNQYTSSGKYLRTFDNSRIAAECVKKNRSAITMCCMGNIKTVAGFQWQYAECGNRDILPVDSTNGKSCPITQFTIDGKCITTFSNISEANKATGISPSSISNALHGWCKTAGGFQWNAGIDEANINPIVYHHTSKTVAVSQYTLDGGYVATFRSLKEAGEALSIFYTSISACCNGRFRTSGGYAWRYAE